MKISEQIVDSSFSAVVNAPIEKIDLPEWAFNLSEEDYKACSPAHIAVGKTTGADGRRMSINVEIIGGNPMVQHYQEEVSKKDHLVFGSFSEVFTPTGKVVIFVRWDLSVKTIDEFSVEFTNRVTTYATEEMMNGLARQGIPFEFFKAQRQPISIEHNRAETPFFARSIERAALNEA